MSWLANRRDKFAFQGIIGVRYFCFEPIRPENPFIAPDSSRVTPQDLWFSLLTQLRCGLEGRLHELNVPLRNSFLNWYEARKHVMRLADLLGKEIGHKFVISIDGIDHAARASQTNPEQVKTFFSSLPSPEEIESKQIRLLIAGQPSEYYIQQYPSWLQCNHPKVNRIDLPKLDHNDIRTLLSDSITKIPPSQMDDAVRVIDELSNGNTLAIVFAVEEAKTAGSLEDLKAKLDQRLLASGISEYYKAIWTHALKDAQELSCSLAGAISLARRPLTSEQLQATFRSSTKSLAQWNEILFKLKPLLSPNDDGFQISHNDIRVFLTTIFQSYTESEKTSVASEIASYFRSSTCDRLSAHLQLFDLLEMSNRASEMTEIFDVEWVIEGIVLGVEWKQLEVEAEKTVSQITISKNWSDVIAIACAIQTLIRASEDSLLYPQIEGITGLPPFLASEASVRPLSLWTIEDFNQLIQDANDLLIGNESDRALGLLKRWLEGLSLNEIVQSIQGIGTRESFWDGNSPPQLVGLAADNIELLGFLCGRLNWSIRLDFETNPSELINDALYAFEKGLIESLTTEVSACSIEDLFAIHRPVFIANWELAVRRLADSREWELVANLLKTSNGEKLSKSFVSESTWFALRSGAFKTSSIWLRPLNESSYSLPLESKRMSIWGTRLEPFINVCRALGWTRVGFDTAEIAESVFSVFAPSCDLAESAALKLIFRTAGILGRIEGQIENEDWEKAAGLVSSVHIKQVLSAIWGDVFTGTYLSSEVRLHAAQLAEQLVDYCVNLGEEYDNAVYDVALPFAEQFVLEPRLSAIWKITMRHGRLDVLRKWITYYIGSDGKVWNWTHNDAHETIETLVPFAKSIGQHEIAYYASKRVNWLRVSYRDRKEYSFEQISLWFQKSAEIDPQIWSTYGWRLWQICTICDDKRSDNYYKSDILNAVSAAAVRCGSCHWWQLIATTLEQSNDDKWHYQTSERFVEGVQIAIQQGSQTNYDEIFPMWSLALCLSYWFDGGDNISLSDLRSVLMENISESRKSEFDQKLSKIPQLIAQNNDKCEVGANFSETVTSDINSLRSDDEFWDEIDKTILIFNKTKSSWDLHESLFEIARKRAFLHGGEDLLDGLAIQLHMHARWTFGGGELNQVNWRELPVEDSDITWKSIVLEFLKVLLNSHSTETIGAAIQGMHFLVDQDPDVISELVDLFKSDWSRRWFLNSIESWAVLYPQSVKNIREYLCEEMIKGDLDNRLQSWIILSNNCDALEEERIPFPIPVTPVLSINDAIRSNSELLKIPSEKQGHVKISNRYSAAHSMLQNFKEFGFEFTFLEGLVADGLIEFRDKNELELKQRGPHRYNDFYCMPLDTEKAIGHAILQILSSDIFSQQSMAQLAQAFLPNEDSWILRSRPKAMPSTEEWLADEEYASRKEEKTSRQSRMLEVATSACLPDDWFVFAAKVTEYTWNEDFVFHYWHENHDKSLLIQPLCIPVCLGGRSFIWQIGEPVELEFDKFVSGFFVRGRQRLCNCLFEIRPTMLWRDKLGWKQNKNNPLQWSHNGVPVAKYEKFHGPLRDNSQPPNYRQPMLDRWIITKAAFEQVQSIYRKLSPKHIFESSLIK